MPKNLWGNIPEAQSVRLPSTILQEQAEVIGELTGGTIRGELNSGTDTDGDIFCTFNMIVPSLNNYRYKLLLTYYRPPFVYPSTINDLANKESYKVEDSNAFEGALQQILTSNNVRNVLSSLLAQARSTQPHVQAKKK
ncbi:MAG TPA: hypothetical protein VHY79_06235 [Rhizomicrobium sp.]|jgi:hypothetical protein|nr:hypothetical protein [Rhizomicrobium sp.]